MPTPTLTSPLEHYEQAMAAFSSLKKQLNLLTQAIYADQGLIAWFSADTTLPLLSVGHLPTARDQAVCVINQLEYVDQQAPREILVGAGFMGASGSTLEKAHAVNEAKALFKQTMISLKTHTSRLALLKQMGLARLHLKQCYRKIPILEAAPEKISWTWAHTLSIKKITVEQAHTLLLKKGQDVGIHIQLKKLAYLSLNEPLAIVQKLAPHLRTNIVFPPTHSVHRLMIKGSLPIFFPCALHTQTPYFSPPALKQERDPQRAIRSDVKLNPVVFLPAIHAHRYK